MKKVNLGSGKKHIPGFINVDINPLNNPDLCYDITKKLPWENEIDTIVIIHCLEHFHRKKILTDTITHLDILKNCYKSLKPSGKLYISVPDFDAVVKEYYKGRDIQDLYGLVLGGSRNFWDIHYNIFDFYSLKTDLEEVGFISVKKYEWRKTEWKDVDSYEKSYLPHMDFANGRLMSLNVECMK